MARRIVSITTLTTPIAYIDTTNLTDATYPFLLQGGSVTQLNYVDEISISGQAASSSSPTFMILSHDSTAAATNTYGTGSMDTPMNPWTTNLSLPALTGNTNVTKPQRSSTAHLMNCSLNAFGGVYFWRANKLDECPVVVGNTAGFGEVSLTAFSGGTPGAIGAHMIYESM